MKLLVTGALGLVGSACVELFEEKGWEVVGIDANKRAEFFDTPEQISTKVLDVDICDIKAVMGVFENHHFDAIIHAAAQPSHDWATDNVLTDFAVNAMGTVILLEATRTYCPKATFVFVSSDKVYGENMRREFLTDAKTRYDSPLPFDENLGLDFAGQRSFFGCSKAAADMYVQEYRNYFGMTTVCFRPGCITGKNHKGAEQHGFLAYLAKCCREGLTYKIFGFEGKQVRDQIHASDLASAFYHYIQKPKGDVYNIGGGAERSVSILEAIQMLGGCKVELHPQRIGDRSWDVHDVSKFRKDYPKWDYAYSLQDIINDIK